MSDHQEQQLELFERPRHSATNRQRQETLGRILFQLRHDQLVLGIMACLLGVTAVFACGVERGKQIVRFERTLLAREEPATIRTTAQTPTLPGQPSASGNVSRSSDGSLPPRHIEPQRTVPSPAQAPRVKRAVKTASMPGATPARERAGKSRYAIQVVTYSRAHRAKRELERLQALGERAFLVMREGRTTVYVGPFPSQTNASEKLLVLRPRYHDCFVKTL